MSCWCQVPIKVTTSKDGVEYAQCGYTVDQEQVKKTMAVCKSKAERLHALQSLNLGCNLNMPKTDFERVGETFEFKKLPLCQHKLRCKVGVTKVKMGKDGGVDCPGKVFVACAARWPDVECGMFEYVHAPEDDGFSFHKMIEQEEKRIRGEGTACGGGGEGGKRGGEGGKSTSKDDDDDDGKKKRKRTLALLASSEEETDEDSDTSDDDDGEEKRRKKKKQARKLMKKLKKSLNKARH